MKKIDITDAATHFSESVVTLGNFDGFHRGHEKIVHKTREKARMRGAAAVLLTFDPHPARILAPDRAPLELTTPEEKEYFIQRSGIEYFCILAFTRALANMSAERFISEVVRGQCRATALVVGKNHRFGRDRAGDRAFLHRRADTGANGLDVEVVDLEAVGTAHTISSSRLRALVVQGDMREFTVQAGHPYLLRVQRETGKGVARGMGYPTFNFARPAHPKALPPAGVYAATCTYGGRCIQGAAYIGTCPTFGRRAPHIEFYATMSQDSLPDIPPATWAHLWMWHFVRKETAFADTMALVDRIEKDVAAITSFFKEDEVYVDYHGEEAGAGLADGDQ